MIQEALDFYRAPGAMTALPDHPALGMVPSDPDALRRIVQGLLLHRHWAAAHGVAGEAVHVRLDEQNLRSTADILGRALELSAEPVTVPRQPVDRVLCVCRHFTLLHVALLRAQGVPARVRCGFSSYLDASRWYDHWITERWDGERWVRDDPQVDDLQAEAVELDFNPWDQPPGKFLTGSEAWIAARTGAINADRFGILDMWGLAFVSGNVISDFACLNKVELLPWDGWGMMIGPHAPVTDEMAAVLDDLAALATSDDFPAIRERYLTDDRLRVPPDVTTVIDGRQVEVHLVL
ncbi:MAG TPA: transglutaminase-like domain-containing protein [Acidimicrobiales bacterium]|nr:transglutaminase-like domain-containing protein [Acidimicrobiales bacterium]